MSKTSDKQKKGLKIVLAGGGTGGHIYTAVAVGRELLEDPEVKKIYYVGNPTNLEKTVVDDENFIFLPITISGMPRKIGLGLFKWMFQLFFAVMDCLKYFKRIKPDCILGTGGYVSGPALIAGKMLKIPYMLHDSDACPGIVTRKMANGAKVVSIAFEQAKDYLKGANVKFNGNPVRSTFSALDRKECREELALAQDKFTVLVMGGSQGAQSINKAICECLDELIIDYNMQFIHQTGFKNYEVYMDSLSSELRNNPAYIVKPYFENMAVPLGAADLVVARAGSLSISEFNICALPSILIPYPYAANDHQRFNAKAMEETGASIMLDDKLCDRDNLKEIIVDLYVNRDKLLLMKEKNIEIAKDHATKTIAKQLKDMAI
ncbi:MAG: undecaprenyldiphospho-muramoylpentapeptide beta-N-acetylglucosaminyltransferase [Candidatus Gastranaerophilales bacterium]|nr:undecaprenyldiphospho-muramoylpentapeptide beta-N-acetylglucosaminyltransferase [Candidatus Gastranaerophilales bacterium]